MDEPGLRERKKVRTRRRIEAAALELFARDGFDATTVEQIAAAADISARTFFHYFPTKEDVVLADYAERLGRLLAVLEGRPPDEAPWESLRQALRAVASDQEEKLASMQARLAIMGRAPTVAARSLLIQAGWERSLAALLARRSAER
ncbi:MAG TPA: TetR family transcriptional regulator, partial [Miltoncostaeaceae bacterium]|nr:TetR family transcriptional regulator [Miltoncostaeaceae bacterium]